MQNERKKGNSYAREGMHIDMEKYIILAVVLITMNVSSLLIF